ncbi:cell division ATP-binding protein FtsE [Candidatus Berkelbacteria bacterium RIFCSPLOWO2_01_FULL_50_28]|uniref:Cell division ATP-binding protein FtsE n=1 Tax=Candidatus Berkelbacteria bacterium RIFCSPLOWO2_01_FULL_50_28 TaxID=1797471 RepID=A0A1F5ECS5_9BACT|nr:MAG: cell division ATP-binding protein FtsE [Candidatus Berkelbacteria bacterium RIFCSPHIGHO2_01_FULL_50_36]OGD63658.1 MAG: cell division ATP-binding protein FtsE [Candidatus Berkelbacteria bacterium RIFCSPHIGHO2_12_FULL_50_11]OGD65153.1 MAG: cell division ATP-binding protein FtsE [Candidatus Berkelbacteria bacterium RIFCSPLOWO2_01_FULL_50_28]
MKSLTKKYGNRVAVGEVTLVIYEGEFVCLVGQSGAGKTTLVKLLTKQESPSTGHLFVAGRELAELRDSEVPYYRRKIGVVFQDFKLLPQKTVFENVAFALEVCGVSATEIKRRVEKVLDLVNLTRRRANYPAELSGGERQRTAIARALVHSPKLLIADEPTGNLDPVSTWEIVELLYRINQKGTTVILATHNRQAVDQIQRRVILMKSGKIISDQKSGKYVI